MYPFSKIEGLDQYDLSHLRCAVSAGEPLNQEVIETFQRQFDITIRDGYGQTESTLIIASLKDIPSRPGSMGKAIAPGIVEVIDKDGNPLPPEVVGDIAVHLSMKELQSHIKEWTAPYKYPRKIEFIRELPKTSSGKIRRIELREMENGTVQN